MISDSPLYSPYWYRVGSLHPRIQPGMRIQRQVLRGEEWFVFTHPVSGRHHRLNRKAYELVGRLDGEHSLETLWHGLQRTLGDDLPTQDEVIVMLSQLMDAGLILFDTLPDWSMLKQQQKAKRDQERKTNLNPFAFRLPLLNPSALLDKLVVLQSVLCHPLLVLFYAIGLVWGLVHAVIEWHAIYAYAAVNMLTPRFLLLAWLAYPFMKGLHELGHAFAVRHWGGDVKEAGIGFFLMVPAPYVDASAATAFPSKWQRMAVSSAGIAVELFLATIALAVWMAVENGMVRDIAFVVMMIGGLSTLVFNANPLMRFDGYYILCDSLELPNLSSRSLRWWNYQLRRFMKRAGNEPEARFKGSERVWVALYAPASWVYRMVISIVIVRWVTEISLFIGFITMLWLAFSLFVKPLWVALSIIMAPAHPGMQQSKPLFWAVCTIALVLAFLVGVPIPTSTVAPGIVWLPEQSQVRTENDGRIISVMVRDGERVTKGQPLVVLEEPALLTRKTRLQAKMASAEADQASGWLIASLQGRNAFEEIERLQRELAQIDEQLDKLVLRAGVDGVFVLPHVEDILDRHVTKGALVAYVLAPDSTTVRAAIAQDDIGRFKGGIESISVRLAEGGSQHFNGRLLRLDPAGTTRLPNIALGDKGGGRLVTDPADHEGMTLREPVFLVDVEVPERKVMRAGGRAWIRFEHQSRPLLETVIWRFRQLFLRVFSVEGA